MNTTSTARLDHRLRVRTGVRGLAVAVTFAAAFLALGSALACTGMLVLSLLGRALDLPHGVPGGGAYLVSTVAYWIVAVTLIGVLSHALREEDHSTPGAVVGLLATRVWDPVIARAEDDLRSRALPVRRSAYGPEGETR